MTIRSMIFIWALKLSTVLVHSGSCHIAHICKHQTFSHPLKGAWHDFFSNLLWFWYQKFSHIFLTFVLKFETKENSWIENTPTTKLWCIGLYHIKEFIMSWSLRINFWIERKTQQKLTAFSLWNEHGIHQNLMLYPLGTNTRPACHTYTQHNR